MALQSQPWQQACDAHGRALHCHSDTSCGPGHPGAAGAGVRADAASAAPGGATTASASDRDSPDRDPAVSLSASPGPDRGPGACTQDGRKRLLMLRHCGPINFKSKMAGENKKWKVD